MNGESRSFVPKCSLDDGIPLRRCPLLTFLTQLSCLSEFRADFLKYLFVTHAWLYSVTLVALAEAHSSPFSHCSFPCNFFLRSKLQFRRTFCEFVFGVFVHSVYTLCTKIVSRWFTALICSTVKYSRSRAHKIESFT